MRFVCVACDHFAEMTTPVPHVLDYHTYELISHDACDIQDSEPTLVGDDPIGRKFRQHDFGALIDELDGTRCRSSGAISLKQVVC